VFDAAQVDDGALVDLEARRKALATSLRTANRCKVLPRRAREGAVG
jgi:hypothetical protein